MEKKVGPHMLLSHATGPSFALPLQVNQLRGEMRRMQTRLVFALNTGWAKKFIGVFL